MSIFDTSVSAGGGSVTTPTASAQIAAVKNNEVVLAYGANSNTAVAAFGGAWHALLLNFNASGQLAWQKVNAGGPVGLSYAVPGTQAWTLMLASFGSNAIPVFTARANNQNAPFPFTALANFAGGDAGFVFCEYHSNASPGIAVGLSDDRGNTWHQLIATGIRNPPGQLAQLNVFWAENLAAGATNLTFTGSNSGSLACTWACYEVTGLAPVGGLRLLSMTGVGI